MRKLKENAFKELSIEAYDLGVADFENVGSEQDMASYEDFINQVCENASENFRKIALQVGTPNSRNLYSAYRTGWMEAERA